MYLTLFSGLASTTRRGTIRDAFAGVTLASMNIPQVLGYTRIAGTPAITGLYTVLLPLVGFAVFGSSRHLVVAADSATAAIFSSSAGADSATRQRQVPGARQRGRAADRGLPAPRAHFQTRLSRRFPVTHGPGRFPRRRRSAGRHCHAGGHARRHHPGAQHSRRCLAAGACVALRQSAHRRARRPSCGRNPARQPPHPQHPDAVRGGPRQHRRKCCVPVLGTRHRGHRPGPRRTAGTRPACPSPGARPSPFCRSPRHASS